MAGYDRDGMAALRPGPYARLGLPQGASLDEIKRAYRTLARRYHPDQAGSGSVEAFLAIKSAYEWLLTHRLSPERYPRRRVARAAATYRPPRGPRSMHWVAKQPQGDGGPRWSGADWYWEGLRANADRRQASPVGGRGGRRTVETAGRKG